MQVNKTSNWKLTRIPTISRTARPSPSTQQSIKSKPTKGGRGNPETGKGTKRKPAANYALAPTFDIPFGSSKTSAKITSPAVNHAERSFPPPGQPRIPNPTRCNGRSSNRKQQINKSHARHDMTLLTLSHKVFQMMPFDIVREVAHIDATVLLGRLAHGLHHLFFGGSAIFERSGGRRVTAPAVSKT